MGMVNGEWLMGNSEIARKPFADIGASTDNFELTNLDDHAPHDT